MKRFWKTVGIEKRGDSLAITLDKRALKTPDGNPLLIPASKSLLATLIAAEWDHQKSLIKPHALPMVSKLLPFTRSITFSHLLCIICSAEARHLIVMQTSLASRAIDAMSKDPTRAEVRKALLNYLDTDTIWYVVFDAVEITDTIR
jgi:ATP synthase F1 complex assembly factor 2